MTAIVGLRRQRLQCGPIDALGRTKTLTKRSSSEGSRLRSLVNDKSYGIGELKLVSLQTLCEENGIVTPLSGSYEEELKRRLNAANLHDVLRIVQANS
jgi:hypothetical protein